MHVVIYLCAIPLPDSAPARIANAKADAVSAGAYIQAVKIVPADAPTAIEHVKTDTKDTTKVLINGQIYILRGDHIYTTDGVQIR